MEFLPTRLVACSDPSADGALKKDGTMNPDKFKDAMERAMKFGNVIDNDALNRIMTTAGGISHAVDALPEGHPIKNGVKSEGHDCPTCGFGGLPALSIITATVIEMAERVERMGATGSDSAPTPTGDDDRRIGGFDAFQRGNLN